MELNSIEGVLQDTHHFNKLNDTTLFHMLNPSDS